MLKVVNSKKVVGTKPFSAEELKNAKESVPARIAENEVTGKITFLFAKGRASVEVENVGYKTLIGKAPQMFFETITRAIPEELIVGQEFKNDLRSLVLFGLEEALIKITKDIKARKGAE